MIVFFKIKLSHLAALPDLPVVSFWDQYYTPGPHQLRDGAQLHAEANSTVATTQPRGNLSVLLGTTGWIALNSSFHSALVPNASHFTVSIWATNLSASAMDSRVIFGGVGSNSETSNTSDSVRGHHLVFNPARAELFGILNTNSATNSSGATSSTHWMNRVQFWDDDNVLPQSAVVLSKLLTLGSGGVGESATAQEETENQWCSRWHMFTMVVKDSVPSIFVDGTLVGNFETQHDASVAWSVQQLTSVGNAAAAAAATTTSSSPASFAAAIDDLQIYPTALTGDQVASLYAEQRQSATQLVTAHSAYDRLRTTLCSSRSAATTVIRTPRDLAALLALNCTTLAGSLVIELVSCSLLPYLSAPASSSSSSSSSLSSSSSPSSSSSSSSLASLVSSLRYIEGTLTIRDTVNCSLDLFPFLNTVGEATPANQVVVLITGNVNFDLGNRTLQQVFELTMQGRNITIADVCLNRAQDAMASYWWGLHSNMVLTHRITGECKCQMFVSEEDNQLCTAVGPVCPGGVFSTSASMNEFLTDCEVMWGDLTIRDFSSSDLYPLEATAKLRIITGGLQVLRTSLNSLVFLSGVTRVSFVNLRDNELLLDATLPSVPRENWVNISIISVNNPALCPGGMPNGTIPCNYFTLDISVGLSPIVDGTVTSDMFQNALFQLLADVSNNSLADLTSNGVPVNLEDLVWVICNDVFCSVDGQGTFYIVGYIPGDLGRKIVPLLQQVVTSDTLVPAGIVAPDAESEAVKTVLFSLYFAYISDYLNGIDLSVLRLDSSTQVMSWNTGVTKLTQDASECVLEYRDHELNHSPPIFISLVNTYFASINYPYRASTTFDYDSTVADPSRVDYGWHRARLPSSVCQAKEYKFRICTTPNADTVNDMIAHGGFSPKANCFAPGWSFELRVGVVTSTGSIRRSAFYHYEDSAALRYTMTAAPHVVQSPDAAFTVEWRSPSVVTVSQTQYNITGFMIQVVYNHGSEFLYPDRSHSFWMIDAYSNGGQNDTYRFSMDGCYCSASGCDPQHIRCLDPGITIFVGIQPFSPAGLFAMHVVSYQIGQRYDVSKPSDVSYGSVTPTSAQINVTCPIINGASAGGIQLVCTCDAITCPRANPLPWTGSQMTDVQVQELVFDNSTQNGSDVFFESLRFTTTITINVNHAYKSVKNLRGAIEVRHLLPHASYQCRAFCLSDIANDTVGFTVNFSTPSTMPLPPRPPNVTDADGSSWLISWDAPDSARLNGQLLSFKLYDRQGNLVYQGLNRNVTVVKSAYSSTLFTLAVVNDVGESLSSEPAVELGSIGSSSSGSSSSSSSTSSKSEGDVIAGGVIGAFVGVLLMVAVVTRKWWWGRLINKNQPLAQMPNDEWLLNPAAIKVDGDGRVLGRGAYGVVRFALYQPNVESSNNSSSSSSSSSSNNNNNTASGPIFVAVKSCTQAENYEDFVKEADCLKRLSRPGHANVVRFIGDYNQVRGNHESCVCARCVYVCCVCVCVCVCV